MEATVDVLDSPSPGRQSNAGWAADTAEDIGDLPVYPKNPGLKPSK